MLKKFLSLALTGFLLLTASLQIIRAQSGAEIERNRVERIKTSIYRLENSGKSKIVVRLQNGEKLKGYVTRTGDDSFDLTNYKTRQTAPVAYRDVARVKASGGSSKGAKVALGVAGVAAVVLLVLTLPRRGPTICPLGCR